MVTIKLVRGNYSPFEVTFNQYFKDNPDIWKDFTSGIPVQVPSHIFEDMKKSFDLRNLSSYTPELVGNIDVMQVGRKKSKKTRDEDSEKSEYFGGGNLGRNS